MKYAVLVPTNKYIQNITEIFNGIFISEDEKVNTYIEQLVRTYAMFFKYP